LFCGNRAGVLNIPAWAKLKAEVRQGGCETRTGAAPRFPLARGRAMPGVTLQNSIKEGDGMRVKLGLMSKGLPRVGALLALLATPLATAQTPSRLISWQPHTYGRITKAGERVRLSPVDEALEIVGFAVGGSPVTLGEPFAAGDEWLKGLTVRVRNISGQTINRAQMTFVLPESRTGEGNTIGLTLKYGPAVSPKLPPVQPGEEFELSLPGADYAKLRERIDGRGEPAIINRLFITLTSVGFADGTSWGSGCVRATNPKNSCPGPSA
jgi:hypothetical protein